MVISQYLCVVCLGMKIISSEIKLIVIGVMKIAKFEIIRKKLENCLLIVPKRRLVSFLFSFLR